MLKNKKWFTLMEIMIVIAIIGTLAAVLYPQISNYILKARVVNYQNTAAEMIKMVNLYRNEVGEIDGPSTLYCFSELDDNIYCPTINRHTAMSDFITRNNPKLHEKTKTFFYNPDYYASLAIEYTYKSLFDKFGASVQIPGRDMSDPKKVGILTWMIFDRAPDVPDGYLLYLGTWFDDSTPGYTESGVVNLPLSLDKVCYPGLADGGFNVYWVQMTICYYLFE